VADAGLNQTGQADVSGANEQLDSWKEIAAHLKRDVTTVRRWEKREGLPVHRHLHERRDSVYAFTAEIDAWWRGRQNRLAENGSNVAGESAPSPEVPTESPRPRRRVSTAWAVAATFFVTTLALIGFIALDRRTATTGDRPVLRFSVQPPDGTMFGNVALSPDGRQIAFTASIATGGQAMLWVRPLDSLTARNLPETEGAAMPFWSASRWGSSQAASCGS
jgi:hypothetical protein